MDIKGNATINLSTMNNNKIMKNLTKNINVMKLHVVICMQLYDSIQGYSQKSGIYSFLFNAIAGKVFSAIARKGIY